MNNISEILSTKFNLGKDSQKLNKITAKSLNLPILQRRDTSIGINQDYISPTPYEIGKFKEMTGRSTSELAHFCGIDSRDFSSMMSQKSYEKGKSMPHSVWCRLTEAAGLSEQLTLKPRYIDVADDVLLTSQTLPTKHELFLLLSVSEFTYEEVAKGTGIDIDIIADNARKAEHIIDEKYNIVKSDDQCALTDIESPICSLSLEQWDKIRTFIKAEGLQYAKKPPVIRATCFSTDLSVFFPSANGRVRNDIKKNPQLDKKLKDYNEYAKHHPELTNIVNEDGRYMLEENHSVCYTPPTPKELRRFLFWTGFSISELALLLEIKPKELAYLSSKEAYTYVVYKDKVTGRRTTKVNPNAKAVTKPKVKYIEYNKWRRLLECFGLVRQPKIELIND